MLSSLFTLVGLLATESKFQQCVRSILPGTGGRLCFLAVAAHALYLELQLGGALAGSLGFRTGVLCLCLHPNGGIFPVVEPAIEIFSLLLKHRHFIEKISTLFLGRRLIPARFGMLHPKALNFSLESFPLETQQRGQRPGCNMVREDCRLMLQQFAKVSTEQKYLYIYIYKIKIYTYISQLSRDRCRHIFGGSRHCNFASAIGSGAKFHPWVQRRRSHTLRRTPLGRQAPSMVPPPTA
jgi:hypothetical protein